MASVILCHLLRAKSSFFSYILMQVHLNFPSKSNRRLNVAVNKDHKGSSRDSQSLLQPSTPMKKTKNHGHSSLSVRQIERQGKERTIRRLKTDDTGKRPIRFADNKLSRSLKDISGFFFDSSEANDDGRVVSWITNIQHAAAYQQLF